MDLILSQPIKRHQLILARFLVFLVYLVGLLSVSFVGLHIGVWLIGNDPDWVAHYSMLFSVLPLPLAVGSMCLIVSCMVDDPIKSTSICLFLFILKYFINAALNLVEGLKFLKKAIIFSYYDATNILINKGVFFADIATLVCIALFFLWVSVWYFNRKEIYV